MNQPKVIAGIMTAAIVIGVLFYFTDFQLQLPTVNFEWPDWTTPSSEAPSSKSGTKKPGKPTTTFKPSVVDTYKGVRIYDNGAVRNTFGRNRTPDGYNLGLKYQCVEFVKRFYYKHFNHKMPDSYGHARDFFNASIPSGHINKARNLLQYKNGDTYPPKVNDIIVFGPSKYNSFGHVAIISKVKGGSVQIVQQNPGPGNPSRESFPLMTDGQTWRVSHPEIVGWLRMR
jgi:hypothetical protein